MNFRIIHTINQFNFIYENNLKKPSCLPICMEEFCAGWSIETLRQILSRMTSKSNTYLPLVYYYPNQLSVFSNKLSSLQEVFKLFDTRALSRIDGMELLCCMAMISAGSLEKKIETCFYAFCLNEEAKIQRNDFCFFLDCLFRGLAKVILVESDTFYPRNPNLRVSSSEIELVANALFIKNDQTITANDFVKYLERENGPLYKTFTLYPLEFQIAQENYRLISSNRLKLVPFIKNIIFRIIDSIKYT